jgi:hypothetical protein
MNEFLKLELRVIKRMNEFLKLELRVIKRMNEFLKLELRVIKRMNEFQVEPECLALISVDIHQKKIR